MGNCIRGILVYNTVEKIVHNTITINIPAKIPQLKTIPFLKPTFAALFIDVILLGPGVKAMIKIYERNCIHKNMYLTPFSLLEDILQGFRIYYKSFSDIAAGPLLFTRTA
jgi:hypothetical protein